MSAETAGERDATHLLPMAVGGSMLVLGEAALRCGLTSSEINRVQPSLKRLEVLDEQRWWLVYERLAPRSAIRRALHTPRSPLSFRRNQGPARWSAQR